MIKWRVGLHSIGLYHFPHTIGYFTWRVLNQIKIKRLQLSRYIFVNLMQVKAFLSKNYMKKLHATITITLSYSLNYANIQCRIQPLICWSVDVKSNFTSPIFRCSFLCLLRKRKAIKFSEMWSRLLVGYC